MLFQEICLMSLLQLLLEQSVLRLVAALEVLLVDQSGAQLVVPSEEALEVALSRVEAPQNRVEAMIKVKVVRMIGKMSKDKYE